MRNQTVSRRIRDQAMSRLASRLAIVLFSRRSMSGWYALRSLGTRLIDGGSLACLRMSSNGPSSIAICSSIESIVAKQKHHKSNDEEDG